MHEPRSRTAPTAGDRPPRPLARRPAAGLAIAVAAAGGCQNGTGVLRRWNMQKDPTLAKPITEDELGDNRNMVAKWFNPKATSNSRAFTATAALAPRKADPETLKEIAAAEDLFQQGRLAEAEKAFLLLEKKKSKAAIAIDSDGGESKDVQEPLVQGQGQHLRQEEEDRAVLGREDPLSTWPRRSTSKASSSPPTTPTSGS